MLSARRDCPGAGVANVAQLGDGRLRPVRSKLSPKQLIHREIRQSEGSTLASDSGTDGERDKEGERVARR